MSNIELPGGFWEEEAGGPLAVSSQRDRRWIADGAPHCRAALGKPSVETRIVVTGEIGKIFLMFQEKINFSISSWQLSKYVSLDQD